MRWSVWRNICIGFGLGDWTQGFVKIGWSVKVVASSHLLNLFTSSVLFFCFRKVWGEISVVCLKSRIVGKKYVRSRTFYSYGAISYSLL